MDAVARVADITLEEIDNKIESMFNSETTLPFAPSSRSLGMIK